MCSDSVLTLKMIALAFCFYRHFLTPHTGNFKRVLLHLHQTTVHSDLYQTSSLCVHVSICADHLICWNKNIPGDVCNSVAILDGVEACSFLLPIQWSRYATNKSAAWYAEWQLSREVAWQPVISQKCLFSGICHISSLSLHFKKEKKDRNTDFFHKRDAYNSCTPLIPEIFLRSITWKLKYCIRKYFVDWRKSNILNTQWALLPATCAAPYVYSPECEWQCWNCIW